MKTGRKRSCEGLRIASSCSVVGVPGIDTTMFLPPWVAISASETPLASMRWRMMSHGLVDLAGADLLAVLEHGLQDELGAALEVETERGVSASRRPRPRGHPRALRGRGR